MRRIAFSLLSGCAWCLLVVLLVGRGEWRTIPGGLIAAPLIGLAVGLCSRKFRDLSWPGRALWALVALYLAAAVFGLAMGTYDILFGSMKGPGWHRIPPAVLMEPVLGMMWGLTMTGYVIFLWPLAYFNLWLLWGQPRTAAPASELS